MRTALGTKSWLVLWVHEVFNKAEDVWQSLLTHEVLNQCHVKIAPPILGLPGPQNLKILGPLGSKILTFWGPMGP